VADRHPLADQFRLAVLTGLKDVPKGTGVLLSNGVDSQAVLRGLLELEKEPVAISFTRLDRQSADWKGAALTARDLGVPFHSVRLDPDPVALRAYVHRAVVRYGLRGKADIECFWPREAALKLAVDRDIPALATGDGGDGYFALSKKAMLHHRETVELMDAYRDWYFGRENWSQTRTLRKVASATGRLVYMPLADGALLQACRGWSWEGLNKPRQKQPIRDAFDLPPLPPHQNLQLGDSGIAEAFEALTPEGRKSPVSYYNEVARRAGAPSLF
jgi:asparagine synthetase B (glutamine-hydrolysing)